MCKCIELTNLALKDNGLRLVTGIRFSKDLSTATSYLPIQIEKIDKTDRKIKVPVLVGNFCPFCGQPNPTPIEADTQEETNPVR